MPMGKSKLEEILLKIRANMYQGLEEGVEPVMSESTPPEQQEETGFRHRLNIIREFIIHLLSRFYKPAKRFILSIYETTIGAAIRGLKG